MIIMYYMNEEGKHKVPVFLNDITARKKAEADLYSQNEYLGLLNDMASAILLSSTYDARRVPHTCPEKYKHGRIDLPHRR